MHARCIGVRGRREESATTMTSAREIPSSRPPRISVRRFPPRRGRDARRALRHPSLRVPSPCNLPPSNRLTPPLLPPHPLCALKSREREREPDLPQAVPCVGIERHGRIVSNYRVDATNSVAHVERSSRGEEVEAAKSGEVKLKTKLHGFGVTSGRSLKPSITCFLSRCLSDRRGSLLSDWSSGGNSKPCSDGARFTSAEISSSRYFREASSGNHALPVRRCERRSFRETPRDEVFLTRSAIESL